MRPGEWGEGRRRTIFIHILYSLTQHSLADQKVSHLTLDTRLDSHYSQPSGSGTSGSSLGTMGTSHRLKNKDDADR